MSTYGRNPWGGALEIHPADSTTEDDRSRNSHDFDRATISRPLDETQQSWLLGPREKKKKRYVDLGCIMISRKIFCWIIGTLVVAGFLSGIITLIAKTIPRHHRAKPLPDNYTIALHKALLFFNAQRSGKLPIHNNVSWRSNSCLNDGKSDKSWSVSKDLVGGYYDAGDAIKFHFPASFAMTMLSWSVIEYSSKYESVGELDHVKGIIKWGTDYFLKTFNSSANSTNVIASQVGEGSTYTKNPNDHNCWMRPENINYPRPVSECTQSCSDLAAEMASALASASIVFKDDTVYSRKLVRAAKILFKFATDQKGRYSTSGDASKFYNSTGFWDEFLWGGAWLYYATGNSTYLDFATKSENVENSGFVYGGGDSSVLSWDNKLPGALLLLSRLRLFLSPGYPYEEMLKKFHDKTNLIMCSYLPYFKSFNRTRAGMIQLNHGRPQPLQYVVNAAFLATLYSDYLEATFTPGWYCGPTYYPKETLREFATAQIDYILWKNPKRMSYVVGYGNTFPRHVHHRGASIPKEEGNKYGCSGGKWKNSPKPNPNVIMGAMVAGPDGKDNYHDIRANYNYTEPTLAGNAGLVAAAVALTSNEEAKAGIDKNTMFSAVPPFYPVSPSPPPPWNPDP